MFNCIGIYVNRVVAVDFETGDIIREDFKSSTDTKYFINVNGWDKNVASNCERLYTISKEWLGYTYPCYCITDRIKLISKSFNIKKLLDDKAYRVLKPYDPFESEVLVKVMLADLYERSADIICTCPDGILYADDKGIITCERYYFTVPPKSYLTSAHCPSLSRDFERKYKLCLNSIDNALRGNSYVTYLGKSLSDLLVNFKSATSEDIAASLISSIDTPEIDVTEPDGDVIIRCVANILTHDRSWKQTYSEIKTYRKEILTLIQTHISESNKFKKLGVPMNFFKFDNVTFTKDSRLMCVLSFKRELIET